MHTSITLPLLLSLLVAATPPLQDYPTPASLVDHFYATDIYSLSGGLPSGQDLVLLKPLLSTRLYALFIATLDYQTRWIARHPDEPSPTGGPPIIDKPPFADGGFFTGSSDGSSKFEISRTIREQGPRWIVFVRSRPEPNMSPWRVAVVVLLEDNRYVIDDVLYDAADNGSTRGSLTHYLSQRYED